MSGSSLQIERPQRRRTTARSYLVIVVAMACSDGTAAPTGDPNAPNANAPPTISITGVQSAYAAGEKVAIAARVVGTDLGPIANLRVTFAASTGGTADPATATTNANGVATTTWTVPVIAGIAELRANSGTTTFEVRTDVRAAAAARINKLAGDVQQALEGELLTSDVRVSVTDAFGNAIIDRAVAFVITSGGGSVTVSSATTAADGSASTQWRVGIGSTSNTLEVRTLDVPPVTFGATSRASAGLFAQTGSMSATRNGHTATLLRDGRVLVAGGSELATAELYDPATGSFTPTANTMSIARANHSATRLADGRVLIAGGSNSGGRLIGAELFDPATNRFEQTNNLLDAQDLQESTLLLNGEVLLTGGWTGRQARAELYNPATGLFRYTGIYADSILIYFDDYGLFGVPVTLLSNGRVLLASSVRAEIYDPATGSFTAVGSTDNHSGGTATMLMNGNVLLTGGGGNNEFGPYGKAEQYNPATGMFFNVESMRYGRILHTATRLASGKLLIAGGYQASEFGEVAAEVYDVTGMTWMTVGSMKFPRLGHRATLLLDGRVLITGGSLNSAELFTERP